MAVGGRMVCATCRETSASTEPQVCHGQPNQLVDGAGWVLGIPDKLLLWDHRVLNHSVSDDTTRAVLTYLQKNQLSDVCVRVNQYAPGEEWRRLTKNEHVGPGWRYTLGALSLVGYTVLPGRVFGGQKYNPYTNSVYLYSDVPSLGIVAAAYAKDVHRRDLPGTYAAVNELPILSIWHERVNTKDALAYVRTSGDREQQAAAFKILYPNYGVLVAESLSPFSTTPAVFLMIGGAVVGHAKGQVRAAPCQRRLRRPARILPQSLPQRAPRLAMRRPHRNRSPAPSLPAPLLRAKTHRRLSPWPPPSRFPQRHQRAHKLRRSPSRRKSPAAAAAILENGNGRL